MKNALIVIILGVALVSGFIFYSSQKPIKGTVLGASVNNFYLEKSVKIHKYPQKNPLVQEPDILAGSAILIDSKTKYPLFEKDSEKAAPIASITKVMTAVLALENYKLDDVVAITKDQTEVIGSKAFLKEGEKITVENLLYCMLMVSGNDAAKTLATFKQSQEVFVSQMNAKSAELGLTKTHFLDPAGLNDSGQSSARDIAILFSYALSKDEFIKIVSTSEKDVTSVDGQEVHNLKNSNRLTTGEIPMDGIIGGKTGFTPDAGHTLVSSAQKGDNRVVGVVLNTYSQAAAASAQEMKKLLSYGLEAYNFDDTK
jgi:D-alanyl-D-alanine carboxypeptidase